MNGELAGGPPSDFADRPLALGTFNLSRFLRIHVGGRHPLTFLHRRHRFNAPDPRFKVLYGGNSLACCFAETLIRTRHAGTAGPFSISSTEVNQRAVSDLAARRPLRVVDLTGAGALRLGVPPDVAKGSDYRLSQAWSVAFWSHPAAPDGVLYRSRFDDDFLCVALYDRARSALACARTVPLLRHPDLAAVLDRYHIALV